MQYGIWMRLLKKTCVFPHRPLKTPEKGWSMHYRTTGIFNQQRKSFIQYPYHVAHTW